MSRYRSWCFTLNNYVPEDVEHLKKLSCVYLVAGFEVGAEGTPHLQGFVRFTNARSFDSVKSLLCSRPVVHLEACRNINASIEYCKKDGDFFEVGSMPHQGKRSDIEHFMQTVDDGNRCKKSLIRVHPNIFAKFPRFVDDYLDATASIPPVPCHALRPWQSALVELLRLPPSDRLINFVVDVTGNNGKTWFCRYYSSINDRCQILLPGRKADMAYVLDANARVVFVDAPRSKQGEFIQYDFLEDLKNGLIFSSKYSCRFKYMAGVHVVVMMNEQPDFSKLSADRYNVINI